MFEITVVTGGRSLRRSCRGVATVGRGPGVSLVLDDPEVSGIHCEIRETPAGLVVTDTGSTNGILVNGQPVERAAIGPADRVTIGEATLTARATGPERRLVALVAGIGICTLLLLALVFAALMGASGSRSGGGGGGGGPIGGGDRGDGPAVVPEPAVVVGPVEMSTVARATVGPAGGTVSAPAGSALEGVSVRFPPGAILRDAEVTLAEATLPVQVRRGRATGLTMDLRVGERRRFPQPVRITVPWTDRAATPVPYYIDERHRLHLTQMVVLDRDRGTMSFETFHASLFTIVRGNFDEIQANEARRRRERLPDPYDTGFRVEEDGLQVPNLGSDRYGGGECGGMTTFALWYYQTQKSTRGALYGKYMDEVRVADGELPVKGQNVITTRAHTSIGRKLLQYWLQVLGGPVLPDRWQLDLIRNGLENTGDPILVWLGDHESGKIPHSVLAYAYEDAKFKIYDPNNPYDPIDPDASERFLEFDVNTGKFKAYKGYQTIVYHGDGSFDVAEPYENILEDAEAGFSGSTLATVKVTSHRSGQDVTDRDVVISGIVESGDILIEEVVIGIGGHSFRTSTGTDGRFAIEVPVSAGENRLTFTTRGRLVKESLRDVSNNLEGLPFRLNGRFDEAVILVTLTWDQDRSDVDLYVTDPAGHSSWYRHKQTRDGGELDIDDTDGHGPEHWTLTGTDTVRWDQEYRVRLHYYADKGVGAINYTVEIALHEGSQRRIVESRRGSILRANPGNARPGSTGRDWADIATITPARSGPSRVEFAR